MRILLLLALAITACLQNVDSSALDGEGAKHFLKLAAQPQVLKSNGNDYASQVTITEMTLATREGFGKDVPLQKNTPLNDAAPLAFSKIGFNFTAEEGTYNCTLGNDSNKIKLSPNIPFDLSKCVCDGCQEADASTQAETEGNGEASGFSTCEDLLTYKPNESVVDTEHTVVKIYEYKNSLCETKLNVGWYEIKARYDMRKYIDSSSERLVPRGKNKSAGSFDAAKNFMNKNKITCERGDEGDLKLIFPTFKNGRTIEEINLPCTSTSSIDKQYVNIGLIAKDSKKLLITIRHKLNSSEEIYDAYDTNDKGQIIKYVQVNTSGKPKENLNIEEQ